MNINEKTPLEREVLIEHAKAVLNSDIKGVTLAKEMEMNTNQFYGYKKGYRKIENAYYDNLLKFERAYQKYINVDSNNNDKEKGSQK